MKYIIKVTTVDNKIVTFSCDSVNESFDNERKVRALFLLSNQICDFNSDELLEFRSLIDTLSVLEDAIISKIEIFFDEQKIIEYSIYTKYYRSSLDIMANNPQDLRGVVVFTQDREG